MLHQYHWAVATVLATVLSSAFALATVVISGAHWARYNWYRANTPVVWCVLHVITVPPVIALLSAVAVATHAGEVFWDLFRNLYLASGLLSFCYLLVGVVGGIHNFRRLLRRKAPMTHPIPCCCLRPLNPQTSEFVLFCFIGILQFGIIKGALSLVAIGLWFFDTYQEGSFFVNSGYMYLSGLDVISSLVFVYAMYALYHVANVEMRSFNLKTKMVFPLVAFCWVFVFYQGVFFNYVDWMGMLPSVEGWPQDQVGGYVEDILTPLEMSVAAFLLTYAFDVHTPIGPVYERRRKGQQRRGRGRKGKGKAKAEKEEYEEEEGNGALLDEEEGGGGGGDDNGGGVAATSLAGTQGTRRPSTPEASQEEDDLVGRAAKKKSTSGSTLGKINNNQGKGGQQRKGTTAASQVPAPKAKKGEEKGRGGEGVEMDAL